MPLIGYNYASKNTDRMKKTVTFSAKLSVIFITSMSVLYFIFAPSLTTMFIKNADVVAYGTRFLRGLCLGLPFLCIDFLGVGVFQSCGLGKNALAFAILRKIVLEIPALVILNKLFPLYGLAYAQFAAEILLATAAIIVLARLFKKLEKENEKI